MPINGRLYELDGLKPFPVDHGPITVSNSYNYNLNDQSVYNDNLSSSQSALTSLISTSNLSQSLNLNINWTIKFKQIIRQRLSSFNSGYV